jgi:CRISPR-associated protein Csb2
MPLSILVRLRDGRYDAADERRTRAEWPPHPARLFCALVASAVDDPDWAALRWLESAGSPQVWATSHFRAARRSGYVVANRTTARGGNQNHLGRTNGIRTRVSAEPDDPEFAVVWPDATPDRDILDVLVRLARRVPYLGRVTSPVTLRIGVEPASPRSGWQVFTPGKIGDPGAALLRVPYTGYTDRLRDAHAEARRAWEVARAVPYAMKVAAPAPAQAQFPYGEMLIFGLARGTVKPSGESMLTLTSTLRQAVISRICTNVPPEVSGHGADGRPHAAYLALTDVGHERAKGHVMGAAVALPSGLGSEAYARLWSAIVERPLDRLTIRRDRSLGLEYEPFRSAPRALVPDRWTAAQRGGSRTWVTATPLMLDRFSGRARDEESILDQIRRGVRVAGYPEVDECEFSPAPLLDGALHRPHPGTFPPRRPRRPMLHVRLTFQQPVVGPVLAGSMRYLGLGLFVPVPEVRS